MISLLVFAIAATLSLLIGGYFLWKTRSIRKRLREWPRGGRTRGHSGVVARSAARPGLRPDAQQSSSCEHAVGHEDLASASDHDAARLR